MKNRTKVLLAIIVLAIAASLSTNIVSARLIGELSNFWVDGQNTHRTEYLTKERHSNYVIQLNFPSGRPRLVTQTMLVNSNGDWRGNYWGLTYEGTRNTFPNFAQPSYIYATEFKRQYAWDGWTVISGTWSPDTRYGER